MDLRSKSGRRAAALVLAGLVALTGKATAGAESQAPPTATEAAAFIDAAEARLLKLWVARDRAQWVQATYITEDTETLAAQANEVVIAATMELARAATRFDALQLPADQRRKIDLLKTALVLPAPSDDALRAELTQLAAELEGMYGRGKYCPPEGGDCLDLEQLSNLLAESRDPEQLELAWTGWHTISRPMRAKYQRFVELGNAGARELGFADLGALWRAKYDMPPDAFVAELDRIWIQVKPLYDQLHCYVRARLAAVYGADVVKPGEPIPAHLLGNMWAQQWGNIYELVKPENVVDPGYSVTERLQAKGYDARKMVETGEA
ncbi:MAG: M2 family metallopeptidase, partial [Thermoanaerobaculia bacterium]|nr:M2 family metallopeptidase [Thermoanaerobaculia bacterium]